MTAAAGSRRASPAVTSTVTFGGTAKGRAALERKLAEDFGHMFRRARGANDVVVGTVNEFLELSMAVFTDKFKDGHFHGLLVTGCYDAPVLVQLVGPEQLV